MAIQSVANFTDVLKEVWTSSQLEKQFYDENPLLDRLEKTNRFTIGKQAQVPIHKNRSGGFSVTNSAGSSALNAADYQKVDQASYTLAYNYFQVGLEAGVLNQGDGGAHSVASSMDLEITGGIADLRKQVMRQAVSNGDALIAKCAAGAANTTVLLDSTGYGYDAIVRGWLYPGLTVDVGTTANEVAVGDAVQITAVTESSSAPALTVSSSVTETANDYVSIANARSGATSYEMNGLRQIAASTTLAVGGLDPDTSGEEFWQPAYVDSSTTALSLDLLLTLQRRIRQKTGKYQTLVAASLKQQAALDALLQNQVRFPSDRSKDAGNVETTKWSGMEFMGVPDIPDREVYMLTPEDMLIVTGKFSKPTWMSDIEGAGGRLRWSQGATKFVDAVVYPLNLAIRRRNSHAAAIGLTA